MGSQLLKIWTQMEISSAWETIRERVKMPVKERLGYYELKQHKPWLAERCLELLDQRKQAKLQSLQDPCEISGDNLNIVRHEASRQFGNETGNI
jgi:hypothetical protein